MKQPSPDSIDLNSFAGLQQYCLDLPGTTEEYPFGPTPLVMKVSGKMYALIQPGDTPSISLKCDPFISELLRQQYEAVKPGYHLNKRLWITVDVNETVPAEELRDWIASSYQLVVNKLTKAQRAALQQLGEQQ